MARQKIVFVDDDNFYASTWIETLRERFTVDHYDTADLARRAIPGTPGIKCIVLDVMMPTPSGIPADETASGLETGLWVLRELDGFVREGLIPVVVLTNRTSDVVKQKIYEMNFPEDLVDVRPKLETPRKKLLEIVRDKITRWDGVSE